MTVIIYLPKSPYQRAMIAFYILFKFGIYHQRLIMPRKQVAFRIDQDIVKRLKFIALEQDKTLTDLILEAIQYILKKYEDKSKE
jgi:DNA polymerase III delta prime subunit